MSRGEARPHWGQRCTRTARVLRTSFPHRQRWLVPAGFTSTTCRPASAALTVSWWRKERQPASFDFLGFIVRQYPVSNTKTGYKLLIRPSKESVTAFKHRMKREWSALVGHNADAVCNRLRPLLQGWANYFRTKVSKKTFISIDNWMFFQQARWCRNTHPTKSWKWVARAYFGSHRVGRRDIWVFGNPKTGNHLPRPSWTPIKRHILVRFDASPDDPDLRSYWARREAKKAELLPTRRQRELAKRQDGRCPTCHDSLHNGEELHVHHVIPRSEGGENAISNLGLVHFYCHQQIHKGRRLRV